MTDNTHAHLLAAGFLGGIGIVTDHLLGEVVMVEWALIPFSIGILFIVLAVRRHKEKTSND